MAETPKDFTVKVTPDVKSATETFGEIGKVFTDMGKMLSEGFGEAMKPYKALGERLLTVKLTPPKPPNVTAEQIAKLLDVPVEMLSPPAVTPDYPAQLAAIQAADYPAQKVTATGPVMVTQLDEHGDPTGKMIKLGEVADFNFTSGLIATPEEAKAAGEALLKQHQITYAVDLGADAQDTMIMALTGTNVHFEPPPEYLGGDGDILGGPMPSYFIPDEGSAAAVKQFNVLGKSHPVVVHDSPGPAVWANELGSIVKIDSKMSRVELVGTVSTAAGYHKLALTLVTEHELAHKLLTETDPIEKIQMGIQFVNGEPFTWEAGTGWVPKESTGTQPYGWYCTACEVHWNAHKGDPVACDSGGYVRKATSAEHKRWLLSQV